MTIRLPKQQGKAWVKEGKRRRNRKGREEGKGKKGKRKGKERKGKRAS